MNKTNLVYANTDANADEKAGSYDRYMILQRKIRERESKHGHDFDSLVPILAESSADLREACESAVKAVSQWFQDCNSGRWAGFFSKINKARSEEQHEALVKHMATVQETLDRFRQVDRVRLIQPFEKFFDPVTGQRLKSENKDKSTEAFAAKCLKSSQSPISTSDHENQVIIHLFRIFIHTGCVRGATGQTFGNRYRPRRKTSQTKIMGPERLRKTWQEAAEQARSR